MACPDWYKNELKLLLAALGSEGPVTPPAPGEELGTCDLVSRPHPRNCCGEAWRALAAPPVTAPASIQKVVDEKAPDRVNND